MKWKALAIVLVFAAAAGIRLSWGYLIHTDEPKARNGILDLRNWNLSSGRIVSLSGEWAFYPGQFLPPDSAWTEQEATIIPVPGGWDRELSSFGYGTYRLLIQLPETVSERALKLAVQPTIIRSAHTLYVNGERLGGNGTPGVEAAQTTAQVLPYVADFYADGDLVQLVIHVSNYDYARYGGIFKPIQFGSYDALQRSTMIAFGEHAIMMGIFVIGALFFFMMYGFRRRHYELLYFGFMFSMSFLYWLTHGERLLFWTFPDMPYHLQVRLQALPSAIMFASLLGAIRWMYPTYARPWMKHTAITGALLFTGMYLFADVSFFTRLEWLLILFDLLMVLLALYILLREIVQGARDSLFSLIALCCIGNEGLFEALFMMGISPAASLPPFERVIFLLTICYVIAGRFFTGMRDVEILSKQLLIADRLKNDFLATASHELRLPLHGMINMAQVLLKEGDLDPRQTERMTILVSTGNRLLQLLNDMLDLSKINEGTLKLDLRPMNVGILVSGVTDAMRSLRDNRFIRFSNEVSPAAPFVLADDHRMMQVLFHLFHYALKWGAQGSIVVSAKQAADAKHLVISVSASGGNVHMEDCDLPSPLAAADFSLQISRRLLALHDSELNVAATVDRLDLSFTLPIAEGVEAVVLDQHEARREAAAGSAVAASPAMLRRVAPDRPRVLIVDDDLASLRIMFDLLVQEDLDVTALAKGTEALRLFERQGGWDLVVIDALMPGITGYDLCRKIRERYTFQDLPILFLIERNQPAFMLLGFDAGANDYVTKPFDSAEFLVRIRTLLQITQSIRDQLDLEMAFIQAQIKPHFLYNTLNTIAGLSEVDPDRTRDLLADFGSYLQSSFDLRNLDKEVPFEKEWTLVQSYLNIEKARFGSRIVMMTDVDESASFRLPPLSLQPIVENAVRHGALSKMEGGRIHISVKLNKDEVHISVQDNGDGIPPLRKTAILNGTYTDGIGLVNVNRRLMNTYGQGLSIEHSEQTGTIVSFRIPTQQSREDYR